MISEQDKKTTIQKIINSNEFKDAVTYKDLLLYLYNCSRLGEPPKEMTIAQEVFGKKEFDTERDAKIRVYIYNLRKKIDSYYSSEGKNDQIKISIPKGHYLLNFSENTVAKGSFLKPYLLFNIFVVLIIVLVNVFMWSRHIKTEGQPLKPYLNNMFWQGLLNNELSTLVVIGDYFLYQDTLSMYKYFVRNPRVNSVEDFNEFIKLNPNVQKRFKTTNLTFLGKHTVWCFSDIIQPLLYADIDVDLRLSSNLQWRDFQTNNIIFIGSFKTFNILKNYLTNLNFDYRVYPNTLYYHDMISDSTFAYHGPKKEESGFVTDYAMVMKLPGPNKNTIIIFSSTHDIGNMSVVESFTNPDYMKNFEQNYLKVGNGIRYFVSVFEVQGFERIGFFPKLLHLHKIDPDYSFGEP